MSTRDRDDSPDPDERDRWLGQILANRYRVEERIGQGGMGVVYRGIHLELGKPVAIKRLERRLATEALAFERFRREAIAASRVNSPFVVQVFDWGKAEDDNPFIVMELLEGRSLRAYLDEEGRLEPSTAVAIAAQILKGLHRIHQAHVLHRDLKPENVFLCDYDHERPFVKLLDFGISKGLDSSDASPLTRTEAIVGTAAYLSPEQVLGEPPLDVRSNLFGLGIVLYEMLVGHTPHAGKTYEATLVEICSRDVEDVRLANPLIEPRLAEVVRIALSRDRDQRFESAAAFLDTLKGAHPSAGLERASDPGFQIGTRGTPRQLPDERDFERAKRLSDAAFADTTAASPPFTDTTAAPATFADPTTAAARLETGKNQNPTGPATRCSRCHSGTQRRSTEWPVDAILRPSVSAQAPIGTRHALAHRLGARGTAIRSLDGSPPSSVEPISRRSSDCPNRVESKRSADDTLGARVESRTSGVFARNRSAPGVDQRREDVPDNDLDDDGPCRPPRSSQRNGPHQLGGWLEPFGRCRRRSQIATDDAMSHVTPRRFSRGEKHTDPHAIAGRRCVQYGHSHKRYPSRFGRTRVHLAIGAAILSIVLDGAAETSAQNTSATTSPTSTNEYRTSATPEVEQSSSAVSSAERLAREADIDEAKAISRRHFESGIRLYEDRNYDGALAEFEAAYARFPSASALQNVALCQKQLYRYSEAKETLLRLLATHGNELTPKERATVREAVAELASLVGSVRLTVSPSSATVSLDGRTLNPAELAQPLSLDVGEHRIVAEADGFAPLVRAFRVSGGHVESVALTLVETTGVVEIIAPDAQTAIAVDGRPVAFASFTGRLSPGTHFVQIYREGFEPYEEQIDVVVGQKLRIVGALGEPTETQTADAKRTDPAAARRTLTGWYGHATSSVLAVRGHPPDFRADSDYDLGFDLGLRAGYRFSTRLAAEALFASGTFVVQGRCTRRAGDSCEESRETAYHLDTRRIGAAMRVFSQGEGSRLYSVVGAGVVAQNYRRLAVDGAGVNPFAMLELGVELNYKHSLWGVSFVGIFDGTKDIMADGNRPFESSSGLQFLGLGVHVGWGEWSPPRIVPPLPKLDQHPASQETAPVPPRPPPLGPKAANGGGPTGT
ncbi:MAG: serine/threonine-protein kinase [Polyangiaceae bacterium]